MKGKRVYGKVNKKEKKELQNMATDLDISQLEVVTYMIEYGLKNKKEIKEMIKDGS